MPHHLRLSRFVSSLSALACGLLSFPSAAQSPSPERSLSPRRDILHERLPPAFQAPHLRTTSAPSEDDGPVYTARGPRFEGAEAELESDRSDVSYLDPEAAPNPSEASPTARTTRPQERTAPPSAAPSPRDPREHFQAEATPDRATHIEPNLSYHEPFNPSVMPYKRSRSLNVVTSRGTIDLEMGRRRTLALQSPLPDPSFDRFTVQLTLEAQPGRAIPLPSVSPEQLILQTQTTPAVPTRLERDEADNLYVRVTHEGLVTLRLDLAAHPRYFGGPLPERLNRAFIPPVLRPELAPQVRAEAAEVLKALKLGPDSDLKEALTRLVRHFRAFETGELPPSPGSLYRQLALGGQGVCRHRVYAFVITAQALGIPARYVFNEAHVFAEVYLPLEEGGFWRRLDLGGAAESLTLQGMEGKSLHQGPPDPFGGLGGPAGAARVTGLSSSSPSPGLEPSIPTLSVRVKPAPFLHARSDPQRRPTQVTLEAAQPVWSSERALELNGKVSSESGDYPQGFVQIWMRAEDGSEERLAITPLDSAGTFRVSLTRPPMLHGAHLKLFASYLGDTRHSPSDSR